MKKQNIGQKITEQSIEKLVNTLRWSLLSICTIWLLWIGYNAEQSNKIDTNTVKTSESAIIVTAPQLLQENGVQPIDTNIAKPARVHRYVDIDLTDEEWDELASLVWLEAGNQTLKVQQAVAEVVFNRVLHSDFPDTVHDVLHEGENTVIPQFSPIYWIGTATPTQTQYDAINAALYGDTILDADVVFFSQNGENNRIWGQIGDIIFCREYIWE